MEDGVSRRSYRLAQRAGLSPEAFGHYNEATALGRQNNAREHARRVVSGGLVRASYLTVYADARLIQLHLPAHLAEPPAPEKRGKVEGFSAESRRRLMRLLHTIKRSAALPAFVCLTFPDEAVPSPKAAKVMLQRLCKRWARRNPALCAIWRIEAHPERSRRAGKPVPHFHLLVWGSWIDRLQLSRDWSEIVCGESEQAVFWKHLAAGTKVESVESFRGVCNYCAEYISKDEEESLGEDCGRIWGIFHRDSLPVGLATSYKLDATQVVKMVRLVRQFLRKRKIETEWMLKTLYVESPDSWRRGIGLEKS